jgi:ParB family chromosome partitioning protein
VDPAHVAFLAASIAHDGVRQPIEVRLVDGKPELIAGAHRLAAVKEVNAERAEQRLAPFRVPVVVRTAGDLQAQMLEIEENLVRHDLNALDRSIFLSKWLELHEKVYPESRRAGRPKKSGQLGRISFNAEVRRRLSLSERDIRRSLSHFDRIAPDVRAWLQSRPEALKRVVLDKLIERDAAAQRAVMELVKSGGAKTVSEALKLRAAAPAEAVSAGDRAFNTLMSAWGKFENPAAVARFLATLAETVTPVAFLPPGWSAPVPAKTAAPRGKTPKQKVIAA